MSQDTAIDPVTGKKTWSVGTLVYDRRGLTILFILLLIGDLVWALRIRTLHPVAQLLLRNHGSSDYFNALMLSSIPTAMGMIMGPFIGYHSDRCRSRWGRRIPYLMFSTPITFLGMVGMALSKHLDTLVMDCFPSLTPDEAALWILGVSWIIFEVGVLVSSAVFNALINDVVPHSLLGRFFALFRIISLIVGAAFTYWFFGYAETHHDIVFMIVAVAYAIGITAMCLFVKEGEYPPVEKGAPGRRSNFAIAFEYICKCSKSSYYWLLFSFIIVMGFVWMPSQTFIALYAKQLGIDMDFYGKIASYSYMTSMVLAYPLGLWVDKFHPLRCCGVVTAAFTVMTFWAGFGIHDRMTFAIGLYLQNVIAGCYWTVSAPLTMRLYPRSQYAQYGIVGGTLSSILHILAYPLLGKVLDATGHHYEYTFFAASALGVATLILWWFFWRRFNELGGIKNYRAPEF